MSSSEIQEYREARNDVHGGFSVTTRTFNRIDSDGVNLQCVNSSDFMVGKQTNFNGPVTIINYADENNADRLRQREAKAEEVVVKEKIMGREVAPSIYVDKRDNDIKLNPETVPAKEDLKQFQIADTKASYVQRLCVRNFLKIPFYAWSLVIFVVIAGRITLNVIALHGHKFVEDAQTFPGETRNYTLFSRKHWGAAEEKSSVAMKLPVPYVIISSTNCRACSGLKECKVALQEQQLIQKKKSESDIYPNFLVSSDGSVYEGRGWNKRNAFLGFPNSQSIEISFIGEFAVYTKPTKNQTEAAMQFIKFGLKEKKLNEAYQIFPANATGIILREENPIVGHELYEAVKDWPRFMADPDLRKIHAKSLNGESR